MKTFIVFCLAGLLVVHSLKAQDDSIKYSYTDTCINTSLNEYDLLLKHIVPNKKEIKRMYKFDLLMLARKQIKLSYEHGITEKMSLEHVLHFSPFFSKKNTNYTSSFYKPLEPNGDFSFIQDSYYPILLGTKCKYFLNIDKRKRKGKNTNGFSGNYISAGLQLKLAFYNEKKWKKGNSVHLNSFLDSFMTSQPEWVFGTPSPTESLGYITFGYGLQRKIGNHWYLGLDAGLGLGTNKRFSKLVFVPEIQFNLGFAFPIFKSK
jgi:hypothetical protein